jgi:hypothetical protein
MEHKTIRISCAGAGLIGLDDLINFQGNLKILSEESYQKLRLSIIELGFSFPVFVWKDNDKNYILDAHQRTHTLKRMREEENYIIPPLPVVWIEASSKEEAAKKVLASTSQYGEITPDGLFEFLNNFSLKFEMVQHQFKFPEIDFTQFNQAFYPQTSDVTFKAKIGSKEIEEEQFQNFKHNCPKCGFGFDD